MMFEPKKALKGETNRKATTICSIVGQERKQRFVAYCKHHGIGQTEMLKQMIDHCTGEA